VYYFPITYAHIISNTSHFFPGMKGGAVAYRASKTALNMLAVCYAEEQEADGIKVLAVHPGEW